MADSSLYRCLFFFSKNRGFS